MGKIYLVMRKADFGDVVADVCDSLEIAESWCDFFNKKFSSRDFPIYYVKPSYLTNFKPIL